MMIDGYAVVPVKWNPDPGKGWEDCGDAAKAEGWAVAGIEDGEAVSFECVYQSREAAESALEDLPFGD